MSVRTITSTVPLSWRPPARESRFRWVYLDDAGVGTTPPTGANAVSDLIRPGWEYALTMIVFESSRVIDDCDCQLPRFASCDPCIRDGGVNASDLPGGDGADLFVGQRFLGRRRVGGARQRRQALRVAVRCWSSIDREAGRIRSASRRPDCRGLASCWYPIRGQHAQRIRHGRVWPPCACSTSPRLGASRCRRRRLGEGCSDPGSVGSGAPDRGEYRRVFWNVCDSIDGAVVSGLRIRKRRCGDDRPVRVPGRQEVWVVAVSVDPTMWSNTSVPIIRDCCLDDADAIGSAGEAARSLNCNESHRVGWTRFWSGIQSSLRPHNTNAT